VVGLTCISHGLPFTAIFPLPFLPPYSAAKKKRQTKTHRKHKHTEKKREGVREKRSESESASLKKQKNGRVALAWDQSKTLA
jgi:hypothetical protein